MIGDQDLTVYLSDFGEAAKIVGGGEVKIIFDDTYVAASPMDIDVESSHPTATGLTSELEDLTHEDQLIVREITYRIKSNQADGTGFSILELTR